VEKIMRNGIQDSGVWNWLSKIISEEIEAVQESVVTIHSCGSTAPEGKAVCQF